MDKRFEYYFYDLFVNDKTSQEVLKIIWEPRGFEAIQKVYREIDWNISEKEYNQIKKDYQKRLDNIYKKYPYYKNNDFGLIKNKKDSLLIRYDLISALNNISLSVPQEIKINLTKLGLKHEMFGSFFNTNFLLSYCCLFPDLEAPRCKSDFFDFKIQKSKNEFSDSEEIKGYLVNPPYEASYIKVSGEKVLEWLKDNKNLRFFIVLPIWDIKTREMYSLKTYSDLPIITELINSEYNVFHKVFEEFPFYDGTKNKLVHLKDPIHFMVLQSKNLSWNNNIEKLLRNFLKL